jgi:hypothetical protein
LALLPTALGMAHADSIHSAFTPQTAERFVTLALDCVHREYPNKIAHVLQSDADARPPRELTPAFYGCFDWHSAVHAHWLLARLGRRFPDAAFAASARAALDHSLTAANIVGEVRYFDAEGRSGFERPYGLAWLLQLAAELREWDDARAKQWSQNLEPLERVVAARLTEWLPKLSHAIREGEHHQTAFALGLVLDWARGAGDSTVTELVEERVRTLYVSDRDCPLDYEPSGHDFLSPCIAEADLVRRILPAVEFAAWLGAFLPGIPMDADTRWLEPAVVTDVTDGKLVHLDGLNLSRAWMLEGIASGLPDADPRLAALRNTAAEHRHAARPSQHGERTEQSNRRIRRFPLHGE